MATRRQQLQRRLKAFQRAYHRRDQEFEKKKALLKAELDLLRGAAFNHWCSCYQQTAQMLDTWASVYGPNVYPEDFKDDKA